MSQTLNERKAVGTIYHLTELFDADLSDVKITRDKSGGSSDERERTVDAEIKPPGFLESLDQYPELEEKLNKLSSHWASRGVRLEVQYRWGHLVLNWLEVGNQNQGVGTQVMESLGDLADRYKRVIEVVPNSEEGRQEDLETFYSRFGFYPVNHEFWKRNPEPMKVKESLTWSGHELYHITPTKNLPSIRKIGLQPHQNAEMGDAPGVYFFVDRESAEEALYNWAGDKFDDEEPLSMLKVSSEGLNLHSDPAVGYEVWSSDPVPPRNIQSVESLDESLTWIGHELSYRTTYLGMPIPLISRTTALLERRSC